MLVYFQYLDKNPGWVTDDNGYEEFPEDFQACGQLVDRPYVGASRESYLYYFLLCCVRLCDVINCDVRYTVMILFVICQLMCMTDPWAHMSFMHSILSLKLGVTNIKQTIRFIKIRVLYIV